VCNEDKPKGRKQKITSPLTKQFVIENKLNIDILQPKNKDELLDYKKHFIKSNVDFAIVVAYSYIIPQRIIDIFKFGIIAVHPSLLPKYRGSSPIQSAIMSGERETGSTLFVLDNKFDHGKIISQDKLCKDISNMYYLELEEELAHLSSKMIAGKIEDFTKQDINLIEQKHSLSTYTKKIRTEDGYVRLKKR